MPTTTQGAIRRTLGVRPPTAATQPTLPLFDQRTVRVELAPVRARGGRRLLRDYAQAGWTSGDAFDQHKAAVVEAGRRRLVGVRPPVVVGVAPRLLTAPVASPAAVAPGTLLSTTDGTWAGYPVIAYQWQRSVDQATWENIPAATAATYMAPADYGFYFRAVVTATNPFGVASAASNDVGPVIFVPVVEVKGRLGCGTYSVYVFPRGGGAAPTLLDIPWNAITWTRVLDDTSQATVTIDSGDCADVVNTVRAWRHEFAIYRDGSLVWQGPLWNPRPTVDVQGPKVTVQFECRDLSAWWDRRLLHVDHDDVAVDLSTILNGYHTDAMSVDASPNFAFIATPSGVVADRLTMAGEYRVAGEEIRSISQIGVDWTVNGRTALVGGVVVPTNSLPTLLDHHFQYFPEPNQDGSKQANRWVVVGYGTNADGTNAVVGDVSDAPSQTLDGVLEDRYTDSTILDDTQAAAAAASRLEFTKDMTTVERAVLAPTAPVTIDQLIPGSLVHLELKETFPPYSGAVRIKEVQVAVTAEYEETVTLTFQPLGTT